MRWTHIGLRIHVRPHRFSSCIWTHATTNHMQSRFYTLRRCSMGYLMSFIHDRMVDVYDMIKEAVFLCIWRRNLE